MGGSLHTCGSLALFLMCVCDSSHTPHAHPPRQLHALAEVKNAMESFVLELRGMAGHAKHGHLVDAGQVGAFADDLENWLYSDEADAATLEGAFCALARRLPLHENVAAAAAADRE